MASHLNPTFGFAVVYVKDIAKSLDFYSKAFGHTIRKHEPKRWGELETGQTTIGFVPLDQCETGELTGHRERNAVELTFIYQDVDAAFKRAVENGAVAVKEPEEKQWGQKFKVGYVRDIDGIVVRLGSPVGQ